MPISLTKYAEIKDRYCICYFGACDEYIIQLIYLRQFIEEKLPGIEIHIGCKDNLEHLSKQYKRIVIKSNIKKLNYAHIKELRCNMNCHPVYELLKESDLLNIPAKKDLQTTYTHKCVICSIGIFPTKSLTNIQVKKLTQQYTAKGFKEICINGDIQGAGCVVGVESLNLFQAACEGIKTALVPTGLGTHIYKMIVKNGEILNL